jgi:hypothetical protein
MESDEVFDYRLDRLLTLVVTVVALTLAAQLGWVMVGFVVCGACIGYAWSLIGGRRDEV